LVSGCGKRELSLDEQEAVSRMRADLQQVKQTINTAVNDDKRVVGGLVKSLIAVRLEILRTNQALLEQRINAIESGAPVTVKVSVSAPDTVGAQRLETEIQKQEASLLAAKSDAAQYTGGLVLAMKIAAVATQEQTIALLRQKHLIAKYGLTYPQLASDVSKNVGHDSVASPEAGPNTLQVQSSGSSPTDSARVVAPPADGPFGFRQGLTRDEVEAMVGSSISLFDGSSNVYLVPRAPKPHSAFENYALVIGEVPGLCQVRGVGKDISTSRHGIQVKSAFNEMEATLSELYGPSEKLDTLLPGSIWREPEDWMMGLAKEERFLMAQWPRKKGEALMGRDSDLRGVALVVRAKSGDTGYLVLEYTFKNEEQCDEEKKRGQKESL